MMFGLGLTCVALCIIVALIAFRVGVRMTVSKSSQEIIRQTLRPMLLTSNDAVLYRRAAQILERLARVVDLEGDWGDNVLSEQTKTRIADWLTEYKKEINK